MVSESIAGDEIERVGQRGDKWAAWWNAVETAQAARQPLLLIFSRDDTEAVAAARQIAAAPDIALATQTTVVFCHYRERADLARTYYRAAVLLNGESPTAWPLWCLIDPDTGVPFFATADWPFDPSDRGPGRISLMARLVALFQNNLAVVQQQNAQLAQAVRAGPPRHGDSGFSLQPHLLESLPFRLVDALGDQKPSLCLIEQSLRTVELQRQLLAPAVALEKQLLQQIIAQWQQNRHQIKQLSQVGRWLRVLSEAHRLLQWTGAEAEIRRLMEQWVLPYCGDADRPRFLLDEALLMGALFSLEPNQHHPTWIWLSQELVAQVESHFYRREYWRVSAHDEAMHAGLEELAYLLWALRLGGYDLKSPLVENLVATLTEHFLDSSRHGGFYSIHDELTVPMGRQKSIFDDDDLPAAGGVAATELIKIGRQINHLPWLVSAERSLKNAWPTLERQPLQTTGWLMALETYFSDRLG